MLLIKTKDYQQMCERAAEIIIEKVNAAAPLKLGLATGGTPKGIYRKLIEDHRNNGTSYQRVTTFNLDEYVGLPPHHPNSYHFYMNHYLFSHIDIPEKQTHIPDGMASDLEAECSRYERLIDTEGGIDLQILGIGLNGHIGFNEPGTSFLSRTHVVQLDETTRRANKRYFSSFAEVPTHAITMGIATIMKSSEIILLVNGRKKAKVLRRLFEEEVNEQLPASVLKKHPHVTIIADEEALSSLYVSP
ncbi:glucosamine-6-phosphate deaminase [Paenactinomyces guangxiensis]|uniref:Glucosamine-6-phosphate deaminase n=1 Tax=Paenactinomyces guangxiensis TaxID=1490290 RepID=A0A7W1WMZ2_9BACL|nr:glucosamine-6-phosphate deaminase [Paenactinomyces guangxiensis]MBA4492864.1 glucosamine-6-phosphate deaminase [Paenactinomyces guangxiensis]MBH8590287.1 glucosamine-6-phosphate deaminase [Paenactinomyces guangxiensis]